MKRLGVLLLPPGWDASPSQGYPRHYIRRYPFMGGERHRESKVSSPGRPWTRTTLSGVKRSDHEATAPPTIKNVNHDIKTSLQAEHNRKHNFYEIYFGIIFVWQKDVEVPVWQVNQDWQKSPTNNDSVANLLKYMKSSINWPFVCLHWSLSSCHSLCFCCTFRRIWVSSWSQDVTECEISRCCCCILSSTWIRATQHITDNTKPDAEHKLPNLLVRLSSWCFIAAEWLSFSTFRLLCFFDRMNSPLTNLERADPFWNNCSDEQTKCAMLRNETEHPVLLTCCILDFVIREVYQFTQVIRIFWLCGNTSMQW